MNFALSVAVLLLIAATLTLALAATDIDPAAGLARFDGEPGVGRG